VFWKAERDERVRLTARLVRQHGRAVVFCRTRRGADRVAKQLGQAGVDAVAIHGDRTQAQRERALAAFSAGRAQALVATDVAARGIHVDDLPCVVHFDPPTDATDYLHRSGRTGRAGNDGTVVSLVTDETHAAVRSLQRDLGLYQGLDAPDGPSTATVATSANVLAVVPSGSGPATGTRPGARNRSNANRSRGRGVGGHSGGHAPGGGFNRAAAGSRGGAGGRRTQGRSR
jgi:superfamily II DNA/RNA helicase